jgi:hypothetical protein
VGKIGRGAAGRGTAGCGQGEIEGRFKVSLGQSHTGHHRTIELHTSPS